MVAHLNFDTFVVYRGDEVIGIGTVSELVNQLHITPQRVRILAAPSTHRRADKSGGDELVAERVKEKDLQ